MAMKEGLIGRKRGMTQVFGEDGNRIPVTVVEAGPCTVVGVRTQPTHGYDALQIGFQPEPKKGRVTKPMAGLYKKAGIATPMKVLREVRLQKTENVQAYQVGQTLTVDLFTPGEFVDVVGETKGKGFQGGVKRHGWSGAMRPTDRCSIARRVPSAPRLIPRVSGPVIISPGVWVETAVPC